LETQLPSRWVGWLVGLSVCWFIGWLVGWLVSWFFWWLAGLWVGSLVCGWLGGLVGGWVGWLVLGLFDVGLIGRSVGLGLPGVWAVDQSTGYSFGPSLSHLDGWLFGGLVDVLVGLVGWLFIRLLGGLNLVGRFVSGFFFVGCLLQMLFVCLVGFLIGWLVRGLGGSLAGWLVVWWTH